MQNNLLVLIAAIILLISPLTWVSAENETQLNSAPGQNTNGVVTGTASNDKIDTGPGNDDISGMDGNDSIDAGAGNDLVSGGGGNDKIRGGPGDDYIMGGEGNDTVTDGPGSDYINLGPGDDVLVYYLDNNKGYHDFADGGAGDDTLVLVSDNMDDMMKNEIIKYYQEQNMIGADVGHVGKLNVTLGVSNFENVVFATGFKF